MVGLSQGYSSDIPYTIGLIGYGPYCEDLYIFATALLEEITGSPSDEVLKKVYPSSGTSEEMFDASITMPDGVYALNPEYTYTGENVTAMEPYTDPDSGKKYYIITVSELTTKAVSDKRYCATYKDVKLLFPEDGYFYGYDVTGDYRFYFNEELNMSALKDLGKLEIYYPEMKYTFTDNGVLLRNTWSGIGTYIYYENAEAWLY